MFESYFQLQQRPFGSVPSPEQYFAAGTAEHARLALVRLIERYAGPAIVVGSVGVGKSLLCQLLADSFRHRCRTVIMPSGRLCTRRALLQVILYELGLPYRDLDEGELRLSLIDHLTNKEVCPNGVLLLVDEADNLTMALLDELRSMTNLTNDAAPCIRLVLFGTPRLEEKFAHPRLESFNQRLAGRFYLEPFTTDETARYVVQQFQACGGDAGVFSDDALSAIQNATGGVPRLINQLTDHALILATTNDCRLINASYIDEAWADLQQLPMPSQVNPMASSSDLPDDIIEFGELDDRSNVAGEAESALDAIETQMGLMAGPDADQARDGDMQRPIESSDSAADPEITLYFHEAHDPFGDDFEEEEVIVDDFVSPEALARRHRRQVQCDESESLSSQIDQSLDEDDAASAPAPPVDEDRGNPNTILIHRENTDLAEDELDVAATNSGISASNEHDLYVHEFEFPASGDDLTPDDQREKRPWQAQPAAESDASLVPFVVNDGDQVHDQVHDQYATEAASGPTETLSVEAEMDELGSAVADAPVGPTLEPTHVAQDEQDASSVNFGQPDDARQANEEPPRDSSTKSGRRHDFRRLFSQLRNRRA